MRRVPELDELVRENRFTISVVFPVVGALGFVMSAEGVLPGYLSFNPLLILFGTLVMRLPLIAGLKPLLDRKASAVVILLSLYAYFIEFVGLKTGFPYGEFSYGIQLGPMISGVPVGLPIFFIPLVLNSVLLVNLFEMKNYLQRVLSGLGVLLLIDSVLDPAAVSLGIWSYSSGVFYGVPVSNFLGWTISGLVAITLTEKAFDTTELAERLQNVDYMLDDMVSFIFLWGVVNLYYMNTVPVLVASALGLALYRTERFDLAFQNLSKEKRD